MIETCDRKFRLPRIWSNDQLKLMCSLFEGKVINVSGWKDEDKQGDRYKDYFLNADEYWISNYKSEAMGFQGDLENELFLDLEKDLDDNLYEKFDVVFSHTVLEHIFDTKKAFANMCKMSRDVVIIVVPFLQEQHADYGDYWRFTPECIHTLFITNEVSIIYINYNDRTNESIYIYAVGAKDPGKWEKIGNLKSNRIHSIGAIKIGQSVIQENYCTRIARKLMRAIHNIC